MDLLAHETRREDQVLDLKPREWTLLEHLMRNRDRVVSKTSILECARAGVDIIDHADRIDDECIEAILDADTTIVPSMLWSARFLELAESWDHDEAVLQISEGFPETPEEVRRRIAAVREDYEYTCEAMPRALRAGVRIPVPILDAGRRIDADTTTWANTELAQRPADHAGLAHLGEKALALLL